MSTPPDLVDPRLRRAALVSLRTAAGLLDCCVHSVRRMIGRGELPTVHLTARCVRVPLAALERITQSASARAEAGGPQVEPPPQATLDGAEGGNP